MVAVQAEESSGVFMVTVSHQSLATSMKGGFTLTERLMNNREGSPLHALDKAMYFLDPERPVLPSVREGFAQHPELQDVIAGGDTVSGITAFLFRVNQSHALPKYRFFLTPQATSLMDHGLITCSPTDAASVDPFVCQSTSYPGGPIRATYHTTASSVNAVSMTITMTGLDFETAKTKATPADLDPFIRDLLSVAIVQASDAYNWWQDMQRVVDSNVRAWSE